jgi:hypothetical protein
MLRKFKNRRESPSFKVISKISSRRVLSAIHCARSSQMHTQSSVVQASRISDALVRQVKTARSAMLCCMPTCVRNQQGVDTKNLDKERMNGVTSVSMITVLANNIHKVMHELMLHACSVVTNHDLTRKVLDEVIEGDNHRVGG